MLQNPGGPERGWNFVKTFFPSSSNNLWVRMHCFNVSATFMQRKEAFAIRPGHWEVNSSSRLPGNAWYAGRDCSLWPTELLLTLPLHTLFIISLFILLNIHAIYGHLVMLSMAAVNACYTYTYTPLHSLFIFALSFNMHAMWGHLNSLICWIDWNWLNLNDFKN